MKNDKMSMAVYFVALLVLFASVVYVSVYQERSITGKATSGTASLNITVGATPSIDFVSNISAQDPTEDNVKILYFNFTATDADGAGDIDATTATLRINMSGESDRYNSSCATQGNAFGNSQNFTCSVDLWYFDGAGGWNVNATVQDSGGNTVENNSLLIAINPLTAMLLSPDALSWPSVAVTDTNTLSNNDPAVVNNTGNVDISSPNVEVTAIDLLGETTPSDAIYAGNFTVDETDACDAGPAMVNGTATGVTGALVNAGNHSVNDGSTGQEQLYFCLEALNSGLASQQYSTSGGGAWTIAIS